MLDRWQSAGDPRVWKLILSPEFGERLDLNKLARDLIGRMERDLGTRLEWLAVPHFNTEHPHVHIALRGIRDDGSELELGREYVRNGIRGVAEDLCTAELGYRSELDAIDAERREIDHRRFTSLDRILNRANVVDRERPGDDAFHFAVIQHQGAGSVRQHHLIARLAVLQKMGLAEQTSESCWRIRRDFETVLRTMQRVGDRQKVLAAHGALLSDQRLQLTIPSPNRWKTLEGRVLTHGEDELGPRGGGHYMLLEGTDAQVHMIYYTPELEEARSRGRLRPDSFVRLEKRFEDGRPILEVKDSGNADEFLKQSRHIERTAHALLKRGIIAAEDGWGGWLGRYQAAVAQAASRIIRQNDREQRLER